MPKPVNVKDADSVMAFLMSDDDADIVVAAPPNTSSSTKSIVQTSGPQPQLQRQPSDGAAGEVLQFAERAARAELCQAEAEVRCDLALTRPVAAAASKGRRDLATFEHNRRLVTNHLIEELYDSNRKQREELKQLVALMMQMKQQVETAQTAGRGRRR